MHLSIIAVRAMPAGGSEDVGGEVAAGRDLVSLASLDCGCNTG